MKMVDSNFPTQNNEHKSEKDMFSVRGKSAYFKTYL